MSYDIDFSIFSLKTNYIKCILLKLIAVIIRNIHNYYGHYDKLWEFVSSCHSCNSCYLWSLFIHTKVE